MIFKLVGVFNNSRVKGENDRIWAFLFLKRGYLLEDFFCSLLFREVSSSIVITKFIMILENLHSSWIMGH